MVGPSVLVRSRGGIKREFVTIKLAEKMIDHLNIESYLDPNSNLALSVALTPALVMVIVCCSIASWMATWSLSSILSNSSMQQMPISASTSAPPSSTSSPVDVSRVTAAVTHIRKAPGAAGPVAGRATQQRRLRAAG